ncbi:PssE/Cps14G family polysaccharide biosynthesis glycosyltransferase [Halobacillus kuroshimensis]|uniref:PssE/Cps14G family polysaccharide biosynthesis glycosyltransferase n=1 Tax=Halobacillus kuroshimensis TaxID=302481 RepID=UPI001FD2DEFB|nr:PssE/Cps14G family polysaccharide biosynthesis glycosyltransferase [Halobacillus kuroshimensis]
MTVGTQKFPFDRLLIELDRLIENDFITDEIIAQRGYSTYVPKNYASFDFLPSHEIVKYFRKASIIITHAGTSSILEGIENKKKVIVVPRQKKYGEHVDNHQLDITNVFLKRNFVAGVYDMNQLGVTIQSIGEKVFDSYPFGSKVLVDSVTKFLSELSEERGRAQ